MIESREHVVRALKCRLNVDDSRWKNCMDCKYGEALQGDATLCHYDRLFRDCLELLEAQEGSKE
jgi:hypothetical protein